MKYVKPFYFSRLPTSLIKTSTHFQEKNPVKRSRFIKGLLALISGLALSEDSCKPVNFTGGNGSTTQGLSFGSEDIGLLNYLYVVEQIQYNFYNKVVNSGIFSPTSNTYSLLSDILYHQLAHSLFYQNVLGTNAISGISFDFSSLDFSQKSNLLATMEKFQNTESQAYNGVAKYFKSSAFLSLVRQIGVVESRHSYFISSLAGSASLINSSILDPNGFEIGLSPVNILNFYKTYINTALDSSTLPSS